MTANHRLAIDGFLVAAGLLVNAETILRCARDGLMVVAESYVDTGDRRQFGNRPLGYEPEDVSRADPCLEILFDGPKLDRIRARLMPALA